MKAQTSSTGRTTSEPAARPEVLIVDNDPAVAQVLEDFLHEEGFVVRSECDGLCAIRTIEKHPPHIVLADVMMPRLSGIELLRQIKQRWHQIDVILMSASETAATLDCPFIQKPFDLEDVVDVIFRHHKEKRSSSPGTS